MRIITEPEFAIAIRAALATNACRAVTGPGRSGAIAAVYASHILGIPFIPFKCQSPLTPLLIIDTASESGRTLRKASAYYKDTPHVTLAVYHEPPRVAFWYEAAKPQRYCHERIVA